MNPDSSPTTRRIAAHWDRRSREKRPPRIHWWESRAIRRHINRTVSGKEYGATGEGFVHVLKERLAGRKLGDAVSVGAGIGSKEMRFLRLGMVESFELFELSEARITKGRELAESQGLSDRVRFRREDAFEAVAEDSVDLVHWNNSLHHMLDVHQAVEWSARVLRPGGIFFMDDFVGPSRFQWSDQALRVASGARAMLPRRYLRDPHAPPGEERYLRVEVTRPNPRRIAREDPSEAADSGRILEALLQVFPDAEVRLTGGLIYHVALASVIHNFDEEDRDDLELLRVLLEIDQACTKNPELESPYAIALATKPPSLTAA